MEKKRIYIVDDSLTILKHAESVLSGNHDVSIFRSGREVLNHMLSPKAELPDLVLLDINMPEMNGYEVFQTMKDNERLKKIPVIFLTADTKQESEVLGLEMGAMDYITKPFSPLVMQRRIARILELEEFHKQLEQLVQQKTDEVEKVFIQAITTITYAVDAKDRYTKGHSVRVAQYSLAIAKRLNWSEQDCLNLYYIALLHDIGKIGIPDSILNKPTKLTDEEYRLIRSHTTMGANILRPITMVPQICDGAKYHHERYDGKGYPYGLKGDEIPYIARVIGIADAYDAITSNRVYDRAQDKDYVINELKKGRGTQFDPYLADVMLQIVEDGIELTDSPQFEFTKESTQEAENASFIMEVCKKTENDIHKSDDLDYLTELPVQSAFDRFVNTHLEEPLNRGIMFLMDIDNFLFANENYGHIAGDHIIRRLADIVLKDAAKLEFTCRISGDEFAIFYPEVHSKEWVEEHAMFFINRFKDSITDIDTKHELSLSVGVACAEKPHEHCKELIKKCDKALYYVKLNGKNSYKLYERETEINEQIRNKGIQIDLAHLKQRLTEDTPAVGAYAVEYGNFEKIYQLIARSLRRRKQEAQIILFSLTESLHGSLNINDINEAMVILERCIAGSLRKGDVTSRYSSSQQLVIMLDSNIENGHMIAERIVTNYSKMYNNYNLELIYNIEPIQPK